MLEKLDYNLNSTEDGRRHFSVESIEHHMRELIEDTYKQAIGQKFARKYHNKMIGKTHVANHLAKKYLAKKEFICYGSSPTPKPEFVDVRIDMLYDDR